MKEPGQSMLALPEIIMILGGTLTRGDSNTT
jgi:hypothetical protein